MKNDEEFIRTEKEFGSGDESCDTASENFTANEKSKAYSGKKSTGKSTAEKYILPDEKIIWTERVKRTLGNADFTVNIAVGLIFMLFSCTWLINTLVMFKQTAMALFGLVPVLFSISLIVNAAKGTKFEYVITDKRVIFIGKRGASSIKLENIVDVRLVNLKGNEAVTFDSKYLGNNNLVHPQKLLGAWTINGVKNPREVYQLLTGLTPNS